MQIYTQVSSHSSYNSLTYTQHLQPRHAGPRVLGTSFLLFLILTHTHSYHSITHSHRFTHLNTLISSYIMSHTLTYSSKTCAQYNSCIRSFQRIFSDTQSTDFTIPNSLHNDSLILELLLSIHSKPTVLNYISAFLWKLRQLPSDNSPLISIYQSHSARIKDEILHDRAGTQFDLTKKESNSFLIWE